MSNEYDVILVAVPGEAGAAIARIQAVFGIDENAAARLLEQLPTAVKRKTSLEEARTYYEAFRSMGAESQIRASVPERSASPSAPSPNQPSPASQPSQPIGTQEPAAAPRSLPRIVWLIPVVIAVAALYWMLRAETMGGLEIHRAGADGDGRSTVVLLHGFGAPGDDLVGLAKELAEQSPELQFIIPEAPHRVGAGRAWWAREDAEADESYRAVARLIDELIDDGTPAERIAIAGFSQGAILAMNVALRHPQRLGAVVFLSGREEPTFEWDAYFEGRAELPVFMSHGRGDNVLSFRAAERLRDKLQAHSYNVEFVAFAGGHTISPEARAALAAFLGRHL